MNPSLVSEDSNEFSENFSHSLIAELSKAYLAARHTHEQDSASYAIQECLKIYGCSDSSTSDPASKSSTNKIENTKLWNSFPDYFKEILTPLRSSKYEIQSFDNLGSLKTPIILSECKNYEEWIYKWCAYLISKVGTHFNTTSVNTPVIDLTTNAAGLNTAQQQQQLDKELKVFPKLQFIIRFNVNVALFILPYVIIKMIIQNVNNEIIDQIFEEIMSVIQLNQFGPNNTSSGGVSNMSNLNNNNNNASMASSSMNSAKMLEYHHICCQTIFNIYDHLMIQLNYYRFDIAFLCSFYVYVPLAP